MAIEEPFIWGPGGKAMTPEEVEKERRIAEALIAQGVDTSPVGHWTQGAARVAQALAGAVRRGRADSIEKAERAKVAGLSPFDLAAAAEAAPAAAVAEAPAVPAQAPAAPSFAGGGASRTMEMPANPELAQAIQEHATAAGIDPVDLATAISYETAGTFDPWKAGPRTQWGQHRGLIQWGEPQAKQYGVSADMPVRDQVAAAVKYLQDRGVKPGMGLMDIYSAINAGSVGRYNASDAHNGGAPGTVADKVNNQMAGHREKAMALLASLQQQPQAAPAAGQGTPVQVASADPGFVPQAAAGAAPARAVAGQVQPGNIDLNARPVVRNSDGSISTVRSMSINVDGKEVLIPTVAEDGSRTLSDEEAVQQFRRSGKHLGIFDTPENATAYANQLHTDQERQYASPAPVQRVAQAMAAPVQASPSVPSVPAGPNVNLQNAMAIISSPWASREQKAQAQIAVKLWEQQRQQAYDRMSKAEQRAYDAQVRREQRVYDEQTRRQGWTREDQIREQTWRREDINKQVDRDFQTSAPTPDMKEYNLYVKQAQEAGQPVDDFRTWQQSMKKAGATNITTTVGGSDDFYKELDKKAATMFATLDEEGYKAQTKIGQIDRLEGLLSAAQANPFPALRQLAGEYGIKTEGLDDIQAAQALINELVPQQRPPGTGPMSDADLALYKQSIPRIINQPGGNKLIIDTMRGITQYTMDQAAIARAVANREISPKEGRERLAALRNPLSDFAKIVRDRPEPAADQGGWTEINGVKIRRKQ